MPNHVLRRVLVSGVPASPGSLTQLLSPAPALWFTPLWLRLLPSLPTTGALASREVMGSGIKTNLCISNWLMMNGLSDLILYSFSLLFSKTIRRLHVEILYCSCHNQSLVHQNINLFAIY